jgi:acetoacetyl-CoA synthetase
MGRLILFVVAASATQDREGLTVKIRQHLKNDLSPRHVPDDIVWLSAIPKTLTGKKIEAPIKKILKGAAIDKVANLESLANSQALTEIEDWYKKEVAAENE